LLTVIVVRKRQVIIIKIELDLGHLVISGSTTGLEKAATFSSLAGFDGTTSPSAWNGNAPRSKVSAGFHRIEIFDQLAPSIGGYNLRLELNLGTDNRIGSVGAKDPSKDGIDSAHSALDRIEELSKVDGLAMGGKADQSDSCGSLDLHS
jgi:hypothetical protein